MISVAQARALLADVERLGPGRRDRGIGAAHMPQVDALACEDDLRTFVLLAIAEGSPDAQELARIALEARRVELIGRHGHELHTCDNCQRELPSYCIRSYEGTYVGDTDQCHECTQSGPNAEAAP